VPCMAGEAGFFCYLTIAFRLLEVLRLTSTIYGNN